MIHFSSSRLYRVNSFGYAKYTFDEDQSDTMTRAFFPNSSCLRWSFRGPLGLINWKDNVSTGRIA